MRLTRRLQRVSQVLTAGLLGGFTLVAGHAGSPPSLPGTQEAAASSMAEACEAIEAAEAFAAARQPAAALRSWQRAFDLSGDPTLLFELGRQEQQAGNAARAAHAFETFLVRGGQRVPVARRQMALQRLGQARAGTARLQLQTNVPGARVELEPERGVATSSGFSVEVLLDAGERRLSLSKPGFETRALVVTLEPGESRSLRVDLDKPVDDRSDAAPSRPRFALVEEEADIEHAHRERKD